MKESISVVSAMRTSKGRKAINQDALKSEIPHDPAVLLLKGACFLCADCVSSSTVSQIASDQALNKFIERYYLSSDTWSVQKSAQQTIEEINANLYATTRQSPFRYDIEKGYVSTFSALILKGQIAHVFHVGDCVIMRIRDKSYDVLTSSHRVNSEAQQSFLGRALGAAPKVDIEYSNFVAQNDDAYLLMSDGIYEYINDATLFNLVSNKSVYKNNQALVDAIHDLAYENGSPDNLSVQFVSIKQINPQQQLLPQQNAKILSALPVQGDEIDEFIIQRELYCSARSHVYLAKDIYTNKEVALKVPSLELQDDEFLLRQFGLEEWILKRINSPYVIKVSSPSRPRHYVTMISDYFQGQHLHQWIIDNPNPSLETVREIIEQVAKGLTAMHRAQILHQDIRPENIMIDDSFRVKIIDMGAARVAGLSELVRDIDSNVLGTAMYAAPEYFLGELGTEQSDLYSLAMLTYYMLSGSFAYGPNVAKCTTMQDLNKLKYQSVLDSGKAIPLWIDQTLKQALQPNPAKRTQAISEFLYHLRHPSPSFIERIKAPLIERHPVRFWQVLSLLLLMSNLALLAAFL